MITEEVITYNDLIDTLVADVVSLCDNINSYTHPSGCDDLQTDGQLILYDNAQTKIVGTVIRKFNAVTDDEVRSQLESFLTNRGLASKAGKIITIRGIMNYYNNLMIFISAKVKKIVSYPTTKFVFMYDIDDDEFLPNGIDDDCSHLNGVIQKGEAIASYNSLLLAQVQAGKLYHNSLTMTYSSSCSSSSSSCSSSSSSCSCSSSCSSCSSSSYIVYMII